MHVKVQKSESNLMGHPLDVKMLSKDSQHFWPQLMQLNVNQHGYLLVESSLIPDVSYCSRVQTVLKVAVVSHTNLCNLHYNSDLSDCHRFFNTIIVDKSSFTRMSEGSDTACCKLTHLLLISVLGAVVSPKP